MKSFRQFLEQITQQDYEAAQSAAENSPKKRILHMREREKEKREKYKLKADETREAQLRLLAQQTLERQQKAEEQRQKREQKRQERANRESGTD